jgi:hypothetical protein
MATNYKSLTSNKYSLTKWEDFTPEGYIYRLIKLIIKIHQFISTNKRNTNYKELD